MSRPNDRTHAPNEDIREYPVRPLVGVGALIVSQDRIVLVRRGKPPGKGRWSIPGGMVELGETLIEAAKREAYEETNLLVEPVELVEVLERIVRDDQGLVRYHYVLADYLCVVRGGRLCSGSDAEAAVWASKDELKLYHIPEITMKIALKGLEITARR